MEMTKTKVHNFSAGPGILPQEVLKQASEAILDFNNSGMSLLEVSHRDKDFMGVMDEAPQDEYDGLNGKILGMLMENKAKEEIIKAIQHETSNDYGVDVPTSSINDFTNKVITWWNSKKE